MNVILRMLLVVASVLPVAPFLRPSRILSYSSTNLSWRNATLRQKALSQSWFISYFDQTTSDLLNFSRITKMSHGNFQSVSTTITTNILVHVFENEMLHKQKHYILHRWSSILESSISWSPQILSYVQPFSLCLRNCFRLSILATDMDGRQEKRQNRQHL